MIPGVVNDPRPISSELVPLGPVPLGGRFGTGRHVDVGLSILDEVCARGWTMSSELDYPVASIDGKFIPIHRFCAELYTKQPIPAGLEVDHILPGSILNCAPNNLAIVSKRDNNRNKLKAPGGKSKHKCVHPWRVGSGWYLLIAHQAHQFGFGSFFKEDDAGLCYNIVMSLRGLRFIPNDVGHYSPDHLDAFVKLMTEMMTKYGWRPNGQSDLQPPLTKRAMKPHPLKPCPPMPSPGSDGLIRIKMSGVHAGNNSVTCDPFVWPHIGRKKISVNRGYPMITYGGRKQKFHNVLWALFHGREVTQGLTINHHDRDKLNASMKNLEEKTSSEQLINRSIFRANGQPHGVYPSDARFRASLQIHGQHFHFGCYGTIPEAAHAARMGHELCRPGFMHWEHPAPEIDSRLLKAVIDEVQVQWERQKVDISIALAKTLQLNVLDIDNLQDASEDEGNMSGSNSGIEEETFDEHVC